MHPKYVTKHNKTIFLNTSVSFYFTEICLATGNLGVTTCSGYFGRSKFIGLLNLIRCVYNPHIPLIKKLNVYSGSYEILIILHSAKIDNSMMKFLPLSPILCQIIPAHSILPSTSISAKPFTLLKFSPP